MTHHNKPLLIVITGPTATGKTRLAAHLAYLLHGEIISADSRQVYRGMNIGTGKDLDTYRVKGEQIPYHLIDIAEPGYEYNVYAFQQDFVKAFQDIVKRGRQPVLCGGTGLYIEAAIKGYRLIRVPENSELRNRLELLDMKTLTDMLAETKKLHNTTDIKDRQRLIRAIEIATYERDHPKEGMDYPEMRPVVFALYTERNRLRQRITERLRERMDEGMADEVRRLLDQGVKPSQLRFYGLEYRYVTDYVTGHISYEEMLQKLNTAIHQFAKRQMTWFRRMEKKGTRIHWIHSEDPTQKKIERIMSVLKTVG